NLDLRGLLLAGIIVGALGVLDDTTTVQAATVEELKQANPAFTFADLYRGGLSVGREHITSLVNTLVLAYLGSQLLIFILFYAGPNQPLWVTLNSEFIGEEIIRTLVGSATIILAVPITTLLAAWYFSRKQTASA
ncbi:MAG: YibE/F family protein, partial [Patescibacteria group bacterium]